MHEVNRELDRRDFMKKGVRVSAAAAATVLGTNAVQAATPDDKKTADGKGQGSPLDLLSSVSEGKGTTTHAVPSHVGSHFYPHPAYSYPPPPGMFSPDYRKARKMLGLE